MEPKKSVRADISRKSALFFSVGLLVAMSVVLTAFEWKQEGDFLVDFGNTKFDITEELLNIPVTEVKPPEVMPRTPVIVEAEPDEIIEEVKIDLNIEATQDTEIPDVVVTHEVAVEETEEIFLAPEESAAPVGGLGAFYKFISENIKYPQQAVRMEIEGKVYIEFVVAKDGTITEARVATGIGGGCDQEALRVVGLAPAWKPGKQRGKPVRQRIMIPVVFKLGR